MKKVSVVFGFLLVGIFLFSLSLMSATIIVAYNWTNWTVPILLGSDDPYIWYFSGTYNVTQVNIIWEDRDTNRHADVYLDNRLVGDHLDVSNEVPIVITPSFVASRIKIVGDTGGVDGRDIRVYNIVISAYVCTSFTWYKDLDKDRYSNGVTMVNCSRPANYNLSTELIATSGDCNDTNPNINPGVTEVCDGIDNNCNSQIDEGCDDDADHYADINIVCNPSSNFSSFWTNTNNITPYSNWPFSGWTSYGGYLWYRFDSNSPLSFWGPFYSCLDNSGDCNDTNINVHPFATEVCNGKDDDCDISIDEGNVCDGVCSLNNFGGSLPSNASWNDGGRNGAFNRTYNLTSGMPEPNTMNATDNIIVGECNFKCVSGVWNGSACINSGLPPIILPNKTYCSSFFDLASCGDANSSVVLDTLSIGNNNLDISLCNSGLWHNATNDCNYTVNCECSWNGSECGVDNGVMINYAIILGSCPAPPAGGYCVKTYYLENNCFSGSGNILGREIGIWNGAGSSINCDNRTEVYACPPTNLLGFFDGWNFLVAIIFVGLVYFVVFYSNKK